MRALEKDPASRFCDRGGARACPFVVPLAGTWTFGDATGIARRSSRPPSSGIMEALPSLRPPRLPAEWAEGATGTDDPSLASPKAAW